MSLYEFAMQISNSEVFMAQKQTPQVPDKATTGTLPNNVFGKGKTSPGTPSNKQYPYDKK